MSTIPASLVHAMHPWVCGQPEREAAVFEGRRISYGEMAARACSLADQLRELGVEPGHRVAAMVTPRPEALVSILACWLVGATWTGINTRYLRDEQRQILAGSGASVLIAMTRISDRDLNGDLAWHEAGTGTGRVVRVLRIGPGLWEGQLPPPTALEVASATWEQAVRDFDDRIPALAIYTSGSTGRPKGALITHNGLSFRSATLHRDRFAVPFVRQLLDLPINHIGALASGVGVSFVAGGSLVMSEQFDPGFTLAAIASERIDVLSGVPAMLARIVEHPEFEHADLSSLQFVSWGAGPVSANVLRQLLARTTANFSQQYGMTESNGPIVYTPPTRDEDILLSTTGKPDPRIELRVADQNDCPVPAGEEGEVQVRLPHPFAGYLDDAHATAKMFTADDYLHTGDLAKIREDGYLIFCGRSKEMYKSGGFNIYPREVEIVLEAHPCIRAAAVIGVDDESWGQVGHAFVELSDEATVSDIILWCRERLASYKIPKAVDVIKFLPRTPVNKVDRQELARRLVRSDAHR